MMQQIGASDDAERCKQVLASISLTYQPITLAELATLTELLDGIADESDVEKVVGLCGSFLTLREGTVYFVHQSAQDFLLAKASDEVFPHGIEAAHHVQPGSARGLCRRYKIAYPRPTSSVALPVHLLG
jgi:hypothetical protein